MSISDIKPNVVFGGVSTVEVYDTYVLKKYHFRTLGNGHSLFPFFLTEVCCMRMLRHEEHFPKILDILSVNDKKGRLAGQCIKMENLGEHLGKVTNYIEVFLKVLEQVDVLHKKHIVHGDIKYDNILIDNKKNVHIIDFSHSKLMNKNKQLPNCKSILQTCTISAPEVLYGETHISYKIDIWSLGCVLFKLITGASLFHGCTTPESVLEKIQTNEYIDIINNNIDSDFDKCLIKFILTKNQYSRPTIDEIFAFISRIVVINIPSDMSSTRESKYINDHLVEISKIILPKDMGVYDENAHMYLCVVRSMLSALLTNDNCIIPDFEDINVVEAVQIVKYIINNIDITKCFNGWYF